MSDWVICMFFCFSVLLFFFRLNGVSSELILFVMLENISILGFVLIAITRITHDHCESAQNSMENNRLTPKSTCMFTRQLHGKRNANRVFIVNFIFSFLCLFSEGFLEFCRFIHKTHLNHLKRMLLYEAQVISF